MHLLRMNVIGVFQGAVERVEQFDGAGAFGKCVT
jgi:hypothetical protein